MKYAVIAAGQGSRLVEEGMKVSKPLLPLGKETMIDRLIRIFLRNNAESINIIVNEEMTEVQEHLRAMELPVPLNLVVKSTPDSMRSFFELSHLLDGGKFCLTTVDTVFAEEEFSAFIREFEEQDQCDALMAVTAYIDDEKPLFIRTDETLNIEAFLDHPEAGIRYISGGVYCMNGKAVALLQEAVKKNVSRMRNFQRLLVHSGLRVKAWPFGKIVDVDHISDLEKACQLIHK